MPVAELIRRVRDQQADVLPMEAAQQLESRPVLEHQFKIGGFTHRFSRPGDGPGALACTTSARDGRGHDGAPPVRFHRRRGLRWHPMPDVYDVFVYPGLEVRARRGQANVRRALAEAFPDECAAIGRYSHDLQSAMRWIQRR